MSASLDEKMRPGPGSCDICHGYCEDFEIKTEKDGDGWLAGADGCVTLNKYLRSYFITTKLLKQEFIQAIPEDSQIKKIETGRRKRGRPKNTLKRRIILNEDLATNDLVANGNDKLIYSTFCGRCEKIVNEAVHLHHQKIELQLRIDRLAETLQEIKSLAEKVRKTEDAVVGLGEQSGYNGGSTEATQKQILGLSPACLGNGTLPLRNTPRKNSPKKLRTQARKSYSEEEELSPETQDNTGEFCHDVEEITEEETHGALIEDNNQNDDLDYEPSDEDVHNYSDGGDKSESDVASSPKKKSRTSVDPSNVSDDYAEYDEDSTKNLEIIVDENDRSVSTKKITDEPKMKHTCSKCPELPKFPDRNALRRHQHQLHRYECNICSKELCNVASLRTHLIRVHKTKDQFKCPHCDKCFQQREQLLCHRKKEHKRLPPREVLKEEQEKWSKIPCEECGKVCLSGELLDTHLRKIHENKIPQKERWKARKRCYFCCKRFYSNQRYSIHIKMAHPEKTEEEFRCYQCNVGFSTPTLLKHHFTQSHDAGVEGESIHTCNQCEWPFMDESSLETHSRVHNQVKTKKKPMITLPREEMFARMPFKCWFCWEAFPEKDKLERHLKNNTRHKTLKVEFHCDVESCEYYTKPFEKIEELNQHLQNCHGDSSEILECQRCSWGFTSENMLTLHKLDHLNPTNTYHYNCPLCDRICKKKVTLINHYNVAHELNLKPNRCPHCPERFVSLIAMQVHIKDEHRDLLDISKILTCDQCGKICLNKKSLDSHLRNYHRDQRCSTCSKVFKTYDLLRKHVKVDHGIGSRHLCSLCGAELLSTYGFRIHMEVVHKKPKFECQICHVKLKSKANLRYHMKSIHDPSKLQGPPAPFVCGECGKGYSKKDSLDDHVRVRHSQDNWRVWTCDQCGKRFRRETGLRVHLSGKGCPKRLDAPVIIA